MQLSTTWNLDNSMLCYLLKLCKLFLQPTLHGSQRVVFKNSKHLNLLIMLKECVKLTYFFPGWVLPLKILFCHIYWKMFYAYTHFLFLFEPLVCPTESSVIAVVYLLVCQLVRQIFQGPLISFF